MIRRFVTIAALLAPTALRAQTGKPAAELSVKEAAGSIIASDIIRRIGIIAHDSMKGRSTPGPELEKTAAFIAAEFKRFGLTPGGDSGSFLQRYPLRGNAVDTLASSITIAGGPTLRFGRDAIPVAGVREGEATGKVMILSGGDPKEGAFRSLGLSGAIVVLLLTPDDPLGRKSPLLQNLGMIGAQQPAAVVLVTPLPDDPWRAMVQASMAARLAPAWRGPLATRGRMLVAVRESAFRPLLEQRGVSGAALQKATSGAPQATPVDLTLTFTLRPESGPNSSAPNTVGILEGVDSTLKHEYVVFSGHMDHIGTTGPSSVGCQTVGADSICNGADDDASGTIAVVELAEAFARLQPRPKRSLIFLTVSGEERGLWGSDYFTSNPPVPIAQIVADLNTDMVGRNWKDTIVAIGKEHSDLGATLNRVNRAHPELRMTAIDDLWPQENFYRRSDHFNFARKGVPILFFFNGVHPDYHQPGDGSRRSTRKRRHGS
ncbi:MAG: M28 family peptidase [Gemmatimonadetes bacterium]|nr:M28 family peptidase [Gemmatimonadota bacterium]